MWRALFVAFCAVLFSQLDADLTTTIAAMVRPDAAAFNDRVVWITGASSGNISLNIRSLVDHYLTYFFQGLVEALLRSSRARGPR